MRSAIALALCLYVYGTHARSAGHLRQRQLSNKCETRKVCTVFAKDGTAHRVTFAGSEAQAANEVLIAKARSQQVPAGDAPAAGGAAEQAVGLPTGQLNTSQVLTGDGSQWDLTKNRDEEHMVIPGEMDNCYTMVFPPACKNGTDDNLGLCEAQKTTKECILTIEAPPSGEGPSKACTWIHGHGPITGLKKNELANPGAMDQTEEILKAEGKPEAASPEGSSSEGASGTFCKYKNNMDGDMTSKDECAKRGGCEWDMGTDGTDLFKSGGECSNKAGGDTKGDGAAASKIDADKKEEHFLEGNGPATVPHCVSAFAVKHDMTQEQVTGNTAVTDHITDIKYAIQNNA